MNMVNHLCVVCQVPVDPLSRGGVITLEDFYRRRIALVEA